MPRAADSDHKPLASPNLPAAKASRLPRGGGAVIVGAITTSLPLGGGGFCYWAMRQNKFTRRIVGWTVEAKMTDELVMLLTAVL